MKNVLIIASLYGSKRVLGLAKYLLEFGWKPTVITPPVSWQPTIISGRVPDIEGVEIIETGYSSLKQPILRAGVSLRRLRSDVVRSMIHFGGAVVNYPDSYSGWYRFALRAGRRMLDRGDVDATISICPITSHIVASQLKKECMASLSKPHLIYSSASAGTFLISTQTGPLPATQVWSWASVLDSGENGLPSESFTSPTHEPCPQCGPPTRATCRCTVSASCRAAPAR